MFPLNPDRECHRGSMDSMDRSVDRLDDKGSNCRVYSGRLTMPRDRRDCRDRNHGQNHHRDHKTRPRTLAEVRIVDHRGPT